MITIYQLNARHEKSYCIREFFKRPKHTLCQSHQKLRGLEILYSEKRTEKDFTVLTTEVQRNQITWSTSKGQVGKTLGPKAEVVARGDAEPLLVSGNFISVPFSQHGEKNQYFGYFLKHIISRLPLDSRVSHIYM